MDNQNPLLQTATFASGCFWCTEAIFKQVKGVLGVTPGYAGGHTEHPSYEDVCDHTTGHAEVIQLAFDPTVISYETLVNIFFGTHNPTQINQQGNDIGEQYRSVIFYHSEEQKKIAEKIKNVLEKEKTFGAPIATSIEPFTNFFEAEDYHKDYFAKNPDQPYCQAVIDPKVAKFRKTFSRYLAK